MEGPLTLCSSVKHLQLIFLYTVVYGGTLNPIQQCETSSVNIPLYSSVWRDPSPIRQCETSSVNVLFLQDSSYHGCLELSGSQGDIIAILKPLMSKQAGKG